MAHDIPRQAQAGPDTSTPSSPALACRICGNVAGNTSFVAREMMFGTRKTFDYFTCADCGCMQIKTVPTDLGAFYPASYYAHERHHASNPLREWMLTRRARHCLRGDDWIGGLITRKTSKPFEPEWFDKAGATIDSSILDVGCGSGRLLLELQRAGFTRLMGADPLIEQTFEYPGGLRVLKSEARDVQGRFDLIMLHHVFEHLDDPVGMLHDAHRLLNPGGCVLVRIPVAGTYAWRHYGPDWVQLDAPRHLYIHSPTSMAQIAERAGFRIAETVYDSNEYQFWGSEQYRRGVPMYDPETFALNPMPPGFGPDEMAGYLDKAAELNAKEDGDSASFYLRAVAAS